MSYIVVYLRADGSSGVEECADLDLAVVAAERLRNVDSVERPRIFKTEEVTYDFKPYYRVEVTAVADDSVEHSAAAEQIVVDHSVAQDSVVQETVDAQDTIEPVAEVVDEPVAPIPPAPAPEPAVEEAAVEEVAVEAEPPPPAAPAPESVEANDSAVEESAPSRSGLFGVATPDEGDEVAPLVEDIKDSVPPRRGLFGR